MITADYHTHNVRCGHAQGRIEDYVRAAIARGFTEIGISDHCPIYWKEGNDPMPSIAMAKDELPGYVDEVLALKAKYAGQIKVRLGLECDYVEDMEDFYRTTLAQYPFDYLIGSVHYVSGSNIFDPRRWDSRPDPLAVYAEYYRLVKKSAESGLFDILGHATAITAYAPKPIPGAIEALQDEALLAISKTDVCLEINTSGYRKMTTDPFPTARMVLRAHELDIPLTYSSDSHRPDEVGYAADRIAALLTSCGVSTLATFEARTRISMPFVDAIDRVQLV